MLSQLEEVRDSITRIDSEREELMRSRDRLILQALEEKVPVADIVSASGVNRARVYQIRSAHQNEQTKEES